MTKIVISRTQIITISFFIGLVALNEVLDLIPSGTPFWFLATTAFLILVFGSLLYVFYREGKSYGKTNVGILKFAAYLLLAIVHALLFVWFVIVYGSALSSLLIALIDTALFFAFVYLLHIFFKHVYSKAIENKGNAENF